MDALCLKRICCYIECEAVWRLYIERAASFSFKLLLDLWMYIDASPDCDILSCGSW